MSMVDRVTITTRIRPTKSGIAFLNHAHGVSRSFGFKPARELEPRERSHTFAKISTIASSHVRPNEPVLAHYASPAPAHIPHNIRAITKPNEVAEFGLVIAGAEESIAEVVLIRALSTIVGEWGMPVARVRLNAQGDKDSKVRFGRELSGYLRKQYDLLDEDCQKKVATDPAATYLCRNEACRTVLQGGPRAMNFLSEKSRAHFREVLEHVEGLNLPYELDDLLVGDERESRITFAVDIEDAAAADGFVLGAYGGRFDDHAKKQGGKHAVCAASIYFRKGGLAAPSFIQTPKAVAPKVFFVQLGLRAKIQGLSVVDIVRRAGVPMLQSFDARSLAPQIQAAKQAGTHYLIIMGAREALDNTVIIRALDNSSQQIVSLKELPRALKSLR